MCSHKGCQNTPYVKGLCHTHYMRGWRASKGSDYCKIIDLRTKAKQKGLNPDTIEEAFKAHSGLCDICGEPEQRKKKRLSIDHDHETGKFRGWLCDDCNNGIARFKDSEERLMSAISYLKRTVGGL